MFGWMDGWTRQCVGDQPTDIDTQPGDIVFTLRTAPHNRFTRRGNDLYMTHGITLLEALTGFKKTFKVPPVLKLKRKERKEKQRKERRKDKKEKKRKKEKNCH